MGLQYSDWVQDPDYTTEDVRNGFAVDIFDPRDASASTYTDPGTPFAPPISTSRLDLIASEADADPLPFVSFTGAPFVTMADQQGGAFGGPTVYNGWKRHIPLYLSLSQKLGYAADPDMSGWDGIEYEDPLQQATLVSMFITKLTMHDTNVNCSGAAWSMRWKGFVNPSPQPQFSLTPPVWDASQWAAGADIDAVPSGTVPGSSYVEYTLPTPMDVTPFATGPNYEAIVQYANDLISPPSSYSLADGRQYQFGSTLSLGNWGLAGGGLVATLRPPRYRLFRTVTSAPPCHLHPRDDDQGVGSGAIWPPPSSGRPGSYY